MEASQTGHNQHLGKWRYRHKASTHPWMSLCIGVAQHMLIYVALTDTTTIYSSSCATIARDRGVNPGTTVWVVVIVNFFQPINNTNNQLNKRHQAGRSSHSMLACV